MLHPPAADGSLRTATRRLLATVARALPEGRPLPDAVWEYRHRVMLWLLGAHAVFVVLMALLGGAGLSHALVEGLIPATLALAAGAGAGGRRVRATVASFGLVATSAIIVHLSGGIIEMHFHFFVMIAVITLYQDWMPFLVAIGFVVLHHGVVGVVDPSAVYNHPDAWEHPWKWAAIHGAFVLAESVACIASWRLNEGARAMTDLVLSAAGEGIYVLDGQGRTVFTNPAGEQMLGWEATVLIGRPERTLLAAAAGDLDAPRRAHSPGDAVLRDGSARHTGSTRFVRSDGTAFPADFVATPLIERGRVSGAVVAFNDTTQRVQAEAALRASESRFRLFFASNPHPMWVYDVETLAFVEVNDAAVAQYGYTREEFLNMRAPDVAAEPASYLAVEPGDGAEHRAVKSRHRRKSGEVFAVALTSHRLDFGERPAALTVAQDISERERFEDQLRHQALHDALTGLPNRALFTDRLARVVSSPRTAGAVGVLFLDLDGFKVINDSLGHNVGDELLVSVGRRLVRCLRSQDTAARIGGDEFLILVDNLEGPDEAREVAERVLAALRPPVLLFGREVFVTASIGIAIRQAGDTSVDADDLVREADIAMYQAKAAGKAQAVLFDAGMDPPAVERLELETDLRRAVDRGELVLHFQPEIDLQTGALVGTEALVRWQHPQRGLVPPAEFIPIAEETGLIGAIGRWVLREACRQTQEWRALRPDGAPLAISVNLSARQLDNPGLVAEVAGILQETGLPPETLRLEITETAAMHDADGKVAVLAELRALGVQLAIDDFGTGYSSLSYLQSLPVNILKIDRAFVSGVGDDPSAMAIVQAIIAVAHTLSLEVTAEGIETVEQLGHIAGLLCDRGQGFYFAKPMPPDALADILRRGATGEDIRAA